MSQLRGRKLRGQLWGPAGQKREDLEGHSGRHCVGFFKCTYKLKDYYEVSSFSMLTDFITNVV